MARSLPIALLLLLLSVWLAASYGVRYGLMEDARWVGLCNASQGYWQCQARSLLGLGIHHQVLAWGALCISLMALWVPGRGGRVLGLLFGIPALVLYTASIAVFAVVLAGLRLVRQPSN